MPDLSPDLSPYKALSQSSGMDLGRLGSLFSIISQGRELQTQQAVSDSLKSTGGDPSAATSLLLQPNNQAYVTPEAIEHLSRLGQYYQDQAGRVIGSLYTKSISEGGANSKDFDTAATYLAAYHTPPNIITQMRREVENPDGTLNKDALLRYRNITGAPLSMIGVQTPGGVSGEMPSETAQFNAARGYGGGFVPQSIPGAAEAGGVAPVTSAGQYGLAQKEAEGFANDINPLLKMHKLAEGLGEEGLGKSTVINTDLKNFLITSGADKALGISLDKKKTYATEELMKYATRYADQISGGGTDARLIQAVGGNPNVGMNQQPFLSVLRYIIAMRRMKQAQYDEYNSTHTDQYGRVNAGDFGRFSSEFLKQQDPRAYAFDLMGADNAAILRSGLNRPEMKAAKDRFNTSKALAEKHGLLGGDEQ